MNVDTIYHAFDSSTLELINQVQNQSDQSILDILIKTGIPILLALIAGFIALLQVKSNVISSSRIRWIEELRKLLSEYYSVTLNVHYYGNNVLKAPRNQKSRELYDENFTKFNILGMRIRMQLNPNDDDHEEIDKSIRKLANLLDGENIGNAEHDEVQGELEIIMNLSKGIFQNQWKKSQRIFRT